jgi:hypothetical protein
MFRSYQTRALKLRKLKYNIYVILIFEFEKKWKKINRYKTKKNEYYVRNWMILPGIRRSGMGFKGETTSR